MIYLYDGLSFSPFHRYAVLVSYGYKLGHLSPPSLAYHSERPANFLRKRGCLPPYDTCPCYVLYSALSYLTLGQALPYGILVLPYDTSPIRIVLSSTLVATALTHVYLTGLVA